MENTTANPIFMVVEHDYDSHQVHSTWTSKADAEAVVALLRKAGQRDWGVEEQELNSDVSKMKLYYRVDYIHEYYNLDKTNPYYVYPDPEVQILDVQIYNNYNAAKQLSVAVYAETVEEAKTILRDFVKAEIEAGRYNPES